MHDQSFEPLFDEPCLKAATVEGSQEVQGRVGCGSIRKNSRKKEEEKAREKSGSQLESTEVIASPKFSGHS